MKQPRVGVLALQGAFAKHIAKLEELNAIAIEVRTPEDLLSCDALIIPGGESTTILRQIHYISLEEPLRHFSKKKPIFGTCAGLILMAKEIVSDSMSPFGFLDITVERNAFGTQYDSFSDEITVKLHGKTSKKIPGMFIRAPRIRSWSSQVKILGSYKNEPILVQQGKHLGCTFHPELTDDCSIHRYFLDQIKNKE